MAESGRSAFSFLHGVVKLVALVVGFSITVLGLVALQGLFFENLWARLAIAAVLVVVVPLTIADRLLPKEQSEETVARSKGLVSDVVALAWMLGALAVAGLGPSLLSSPLTAESDRFAARGNAQLARFSGWLASRGSAAEPSEPAADPDAKKAGEGEETKAGDETKADAEAEKGDAKAADTKAAADKKADAAKAPAPAPAGDRETQTPAELFTAYAPSVVTIKVSGLRGTGAGTGFFVDDKGTIATNHHVIDGGDSVKIKFYDGSTNSKVELIAENTDIDLALLHVEMDDASTPVTLGDSDGVTVGEQVVVIGNPLGLEHTLTDGLVSSRRLYKGKKFIQMSAPVSPGNSGGPVFNQYGDVVGVTVAKVMMGLGENLNLAIPVNELKDMLAAEHDAPRKFGASSW